MRNMSIGNKLFGGFGALFLALLVVGIGGWRSAGRLNDRVVELANVSGRAMQLAGEARYLAATLNARQRRVVILAAKGDMAGLQAESEALESETRGRWSTGSIRSPASPRATACTRPRSTPGA